MYFRSDIVIAAARRTCPQGWRAAISAPDTFAAVVEEFRSGRPLTVYSGASDATIYGAPAVNHAFRAWHDATHAALGADFTYAGEIATARAQVALARHLGAGPRELAALWADTAGQVAYFARTGRFVKDQARFVRTILEG